MKTEVHSHVHVVLGSWQTKDKNM